MNKVSTKLTGLIIASPRCNWTGIKNEKWTINSERSPAAVGRSAGFIVAAGLPCGTDDWCGMVRVIDCCTREILGRELNRTARAKTAELALEGP